MRLLPLLLALCVGLAGCTAIKRALVAGQLQVTLAEFMPPGTDLGRVAEDLYTYRWLGYRSAFLTTPDGVILFDPLNADAARAMAVEIARVAPNPVIRYVVYTHHHRDHASGAAALPGSPVIVAHGNAARAIAGAGHDDVLPPTRTFDTDTYDLSLGGRTVRLLYLGTSHTDGLVAAIVPHRRALIVVDVLTPHALPPFGAPGSSFLGIKAAVTKLAAQDFDVLIPGHGDVAAKQDLLEYGAFLDDLEQAFRASMASRGLTDLGNRETFRRGQEELADMFFEVEDRLRPRYGSWRMFDSQILLTTQWCFLSILLGE